MPISNIQFSVTLFGTGLGSDLTSIFWTQTVKKWLIRLLTKFIIIVNFNEKDRAINRVYFFNSDTIFGKQFLRTLCPFLFIVCAYSKNSCIKVRLEHKRHIYALTTFDQQWDMMCHSFQNKMVKLTNKLKVSFHCHITDFTSKTKTLHLSSTCSLVPSTPKYSLISYFCC